MGRSVSLESQTAGFVFKSPDRTTREGKVQKTLLFPGRSGNGVTLRQNSRSLKCRETRL